jgi:hypothetical protein
MCSMACGGDDASASSLTEAGSSTTDAGSSSTGSSSTGSADASTGSADASTGSADASTGSADASTGTTGDAPEIPAACEAFGLPAEWGQETVAGHFTTAAQFEAAGLEAWLGELPAGEQPVLVLATHDDYDCDHVLEDGEINTGYGYSRQIVYVFPGAIELGAYAIGVDVRAYSIQWIGDGGGNGGGGGGEIEAGTLTIVNASETCITGTQAVDDGPAYGFAVSTDAACG